MRPGQNKRMRGRSNSGSNNNRKGPNPLTRSYESNGPDVKIRGTAHHIGEKYLQLARDAQSSGDPVMAESYLQHAEHYFRLIAAAQLAQQQAAYGYQRPPGEQEPDDDGDDDFESLPDRFASPSEQRAAQQPQQPQAPQPYADRQPYNGNGGGQPYEARRQGYDRQSQPQPHYDRPPQQGYDRNHDSRNQQGGQDQRNQDQRNQDQRNQQGGPDARGERSFDNRSRGNGHQEDRNGQGYPDRGQQDRSQQQDRAQQQDRGRQDRPQRDYDNRNFRNDRDRGQRDFREGPQPRAAQADEQPSVGLPAFITGPSRAQPDASTHEAEPNEAAVAARDAAPEAGDETPHLRPRRRRRPKGEFAGGEGEAQPQAEETSAGD